MDFLDNLSPAPVPLGAKRATTTAGRRGRGGNRTARCHPGLGTGRVPCGGKSGEETERSNDDFYRQRDRGRIAGRDRGCGHVVGGVAEAEKRECPLRLARFQPPSALQEANNSGRRKPYYQGLAEKSGSVWPTNTSSIGRISKTYLTKVLIRRLGSAGACPRDQSSRARPHGMDPAGSWRRSDSRGCNLPCAASAGVAFTFSHASRQGAWPGRIPCHVAPSGGEIPALHSLQPLLFPPLVEKSPRRAAILLSP